MNFYLPIRLLTRYLGTRSRLLLLILAHLIHKRYVGLFIDPVLACNLRCQMCYFSDPERRKIYRGERLESNDLALLRKHAFPFALKLQLGCGAEPTLNRHLEDWITAAREDGIPFISMVTNGQLLEHSQLHRYVKAGLNELILSMHGVKKETYEWLMSGAKHKKFVEILQTASMLSSQYPHFSLRINYTFNPDNFAELAELADFLSPFDIGTLQLRPMQSLGATSYHNLSIEGILASYHATIPTLVKQLQARGVSVIYPTPEQINQTDPSISYRANLFEEATYCYISARPYDNDDFMWRTENLRQFTQRMQLIRKMLWAAIKRKDNAPIKKSPHSTQKMNYTL